MKKGHIILVGIDMPIDNLMAEAYDSLPAGPAIELVQYYEDHISECCTFFLDSAKIKL